MTADLQDLFDQAGMNPPTGALDADAVLRRARRSRNRRATGAVAAAMAVTLALALAVGVAQRRLSADPGPAHPVPTDPTPTDPVPTQPALGSLGQLAYGIDGDIYVADADGRNAVRIADGTPGVDGDCEGYWGEGPLWSPDGRYLAYRGDKNGGGTTTSGCSWSNTVNISDPSGQSIASFPSDGWAIAWSPDSTRVAAWVDIYTHHTLGIYGLDGVRQALLTVPSEIWPQGDFDPVWSPDGTSLLLPGVEIPVDGSTPRQLPAVDDPPSQLTVTYSPNGAEIAYISPDGLSVAAADGSQARLLVPGALDEDFTYAPYGLEWSPTGDRIAFVHGTESTGPGDSERCRAAGADCDAAELAVVDVASGSVVSLAEMDGFWAVPSIKFSPEGDQILFPRRDATDASSLWSVQADGSDLHRLVAGTDWGDWQTVPDAPRQGDVE